MTLKIRLKGSIYGIIPVSWSYSTFLDNQAEIVGGGLIAAKLNGQPVKAGPLRGTISAEVS